MFSLSCDYVVLLLIKFCYSFQCQIITFCGSTSKYDFFWICRYEVSYLLSGILSVFLCSPSICMASRMWISKLIRHVREHGVKYSKSKLIFTLDLRVMWLGYQGRLDVETSSSLLEVTHQRKYAWRQTLLWTLNEKVKSLIFRLGVFNLVLVFNVNWRYSSIKSSCSKLFTFECYTPINAILQKSKRSFLHIKHYSYHITCPECFSVLLPQSV